MLGEGVAVWFIQGAYQGLDDKAIVAVQAGAEGLGAVCRVEHPADGSHRVCSALQRKADSALYRAKGAGRNRVVVDHTLLWGSASSG